MTARIAAMASPPPMRRLNTRRTDLRLMSLLSPGPIAIFAIFPGPRTIASGQLAVKPTESRLRIRRSRALRPDRRGQFFEPAAEAVAGHVQPTLDGAYWGGKVLAHLPQRTRPEVKR